MQPLYTVLGRPVDAARLLLDPRCRRQSIRVNAAVRSPARKGTNVATLLERKSIGRPGRATPLYVAARVTSMGPLDNDETSPRNATDGKNGHVDAAAVVGRWRRSTQGQGRWHAGGRWSPRRASSRSTRVSSAN